MTDSFDVTVAMIRESASEHLKKKMVEAAATALEDLLDVSPGTALIVAEDALRAAFQAIE